MIGFDEVLKMDSIQETLIGLWQESCRSIGLDPLPPTYLKVSIPPDSRLDIKFDLIPKNYFDGARTHPIFLDDARKYSRLSVNVQSDTAELLIQHLSDERQYSLACIAAAFYQIDRCGAHEVFAGEVDEQFRILSEYVQHLIGIDSHSSIWRRNTKYTILGRYLYEKRLPKIKLSASLGEAIKFAASMFKLAFKEYVLVEYSDVDGPDSRSELIPVVYERGLQGLLEGGRREILLNRTERDSYVRRECLRQQGSKCKACGFDPISLYGASFKRVIEVHHLSPLSESGSCFTDPRIDVVPLCASCHRMIHCWPGGTSDVAGLRAFLISKTKAGDR